MTRVAVVVCLALAVTRVGAVRTTASPVQKVISLLDTMAAKVEKDLKESTRNFELFAKSCGDEATAKENSITSSKEEIENLEASMEAAKATDTELNTGIQDLAGQISDSEAEFQAASAVREKERAEFVASEKELVETVDSLAKAESALKKKKATSLAQMSKAERAEIQRVVQGFGLVVEGAWVSQAPEGTLKSFLQRRDGDDDDDDGNDNELSFVAEPEGANAPEGGGDGILATIADMLEKAENQLSEARKAEMKTQQEFQLLTQGTQNQLAALKKDMAEDGQKKQANIQDLANCEENHAVESKSLHETQKLLAELKRDCQDKAGEFEEETKDSTGELEALGKAKAILEKKFSAASFLQVSSRTRVTSRATALQRLRSKTRSKSLLDSEEEEEARKTEALHGLQDLGRRLHSTALVSLALRAAEDPFAKVRSMIEDMVAKLLAEAAEEADQKAFCDKEIGEAKTSQADKGQKLDTLNARMEKLESVSARLSEEISTLTSEVGEIDTAVRQATELRTEQKAAFQAAAKDFAESQEACAAAITVLREYYEGGPSFVQVSSKSRLRARARSAAAADSDDAAEDALEGGEGIIGLLEVSESEFATMLAEAKAAEQRDQDEFAKLMSDNQVLKATMLVDIKSRETEQKNSRTTLDGFSSDKEGLTQELDAVDEYLTKLKPQCETKVPTYAEIAARREKEIQGLKTALETLEG